MTVMFAVILDKVNPNFKKDKSNQNYGCLCHQIFQKSADCEKNNRNG